MEEDTFSFNSFLTPTDQVLQFSNKLSQSVIQSNTIFKDPENNISLLNIMNKSVKYLSQQV